MNSTATCKHIEVDLLSLVSVPEVRLTLGGPGRWRGSTFRMTLRNGYAFYYKVPTGFADGTASEVILQYTGGYKFI